MREVDQELFNAVEQGNLVRVQRCLDRGADIHARDSTKAGKKPIHVAAIEGHMDVVEFFLNKGISVDEADKEGRTSLYYAAWNGHLAIIKFLMNKGANIHAGNSTYGKKPIHVVATEGHQEIIEFLLSQGASVNDIDKDGWTSLHYAANDGQLEVAEFLVSKGADIHVKNNDGKTPLDIAREEGHTGILDILDGTKTRRESSTYTSLHDAAKKGDLEAIKYLISKGASINDLNENGWTPLHITAAYGHKDVVEFFFNQEGADIDAPGRDGWTPLHLAAKRGHLEVIQFLLDKKANIHAKDTDGYIALHIAAKSGHKNVVEFFVNKGLDVNCLGRKGFTPLHLAAERGHLEVIRFLLDKKANIHAKNANGDMALHLAALNGYKNIVEFLLNQEGVDIDASGWNNCTALHSAAEKGHLEVVQFLLEKGANIDARDNHNKTPLDYAREKRHKEVVETLGYHNLSRIAAEKGKLEAIKYIVNTGIVNINEHDENGFTLLHHAASEGELEIVEFLIEKGADINARDNSGRTPLDCAREEGHTEILDILDGSDTERESPTYTSLHDAAENGDLEAVKYLIRKGADVNDPNEDGWTPLHCAASEGESEVAEFLISKGANIHAKDNTSAGKKPIHVAAMEGCTNIVELFLSKGVNINDPDKEGRTSLYYAAWKGKLDTVEFLIDGGADVHAENIYGTKPIHVATDGHQEIVEFLLSNGASIHDTNKEGSTPLHFAAWDGYLDVVTFLVDKGADINARDNSGRTPLDCAREEGHKEIVGYLTFSVAEIFREEGKYNKAWQAYQETFDIQKVVLGPDHPDTLLTRHNMAVVLDDQGNYSKALETYQEVFEKRKGVLGPDHPDTLSTRNNMAVVLDKQGKYDAALNAYTEVLNIRKVILGPDHPNTLGTRHNMAIALSNQGKYSEALKSYQAVFEKRRDVLGPDHPDTLRTYNNMAVALSKQGKHSEALKTYQAILDIQQRRDVLGPNHPDTLMTRNNMAGVLDKQGNYSEALEIYREVFNVQRRRDVLGPDHPDTLITRSNMAGVLCNQGNYSEALRILREVLDIKKAKLGSDHSSTLLTIRNIEIVREKVSTESQREPQRQESECSIQSYQGQQKAHLHLSQFVSRNLQNAPIKPVRQGLYLPSFEARNVKINGKCTAITRGLSQALLSQGGESFLSNLKTSAEIYERLAQGKQASKREEREVFAFSKLLDDFEQQLDSTTNSLPSSLIHNKGYKTFGDLSSYIAKVKGNFAIHLVTSNHVVAIYRTGDNYAYFDSNATFVSGLKSVDQLMKVVEKGIKSASYKVEKEGLLVEHFDVEQANKLLSNENKQILAKEIKTERQLLAEQDKELGLIKVNGQEISRVQLYDFGTKIHVEGGVPVLINADMNLSSKKFQDHLDKKEISMTAREYLGNLKSSKNVEEVIQATKVIPFEGSRREIEEAEQTCKLKGSSLEQLVKGTINSILAAVSLTSASQSGGLQPQTTDETVGRPESYLSGVAVKNQQRSPGF